MIALDAVPFRVVEEACRAGAFADWAPPSAVVAPFPTVTHVAFASLFLPFGVPPSSGYELRHFDTTANATVGGGRPRYGREVPPWFEFFDLPHRSLMAELSNYVSPRSAARSAVDEIERAVLASSHDVFMAYVGATDGLMHIYGDEHMVELLVELDASLVDLQRRHREIRGPTTADRPLLRPRLRPREDPARRGARPTAARRGTARGRPARRARRRRGAEVRSGQLRGAVPARRRTGRRRRGRRRASRSGGAGGVLAGARRGRDRLACGPGARPLAGPGRRDAVRLRGPRRRSAAAGAGPPPARRHGAARRRGVRAPTTTGCARPRSSTTPTRSRRLGLALTGDRIQSRADVLFSLGPSWAGGWHSAVVGAWVRGGRLAGTHGGLDRESSLGFLLVNDREFAVPPAVRSDAALARFAALMVRPSSR